MFASVDPQSNVPEGGALAAHDRHVGQRQQAPRSVAKWFHGYKLSGKRQSSGKKKEVKTVRFSPPGVGWGVA